MKTLDIVVAKYKEDVTWLDFFPFIPWIALFEDKPFGIRKFIYSKDENENNSDYVRLPNIGREAHTYLYHIIHNYDTLADYTFFCQGDPRPHLCPFYSCEFDFKHYLMASFDYDFFPIGYRRHIDNDSGYPHGYLPDEKYGNILAKFYKDVFGSSDGCPRFFVYIFGANFVVKRDCIRQFDIQFYKKVLELINKYPSQEQGGDKLVNFECLMERMWCHIFK
jgi:hypothetical protein